MEIKDIYLTHAQIDLYISHLQEQERSISTLKKYRHDLNELAQALHGEPITKSLLIRWKQELAEAYAPATVNSMLAAVNGFLSYVDRRDLIVKALKIQRNIFLDEHRELTKAEYVRLVKAAERQDNRRLSLVIQTICATGIRVSELRYITVESLQTGRVMIANKGKRRLLFLPEKLCRMLKQYVRNQKKPAGPVFTTRTGRPLDRSNIWRDMQKLCEDAHVDASKVFPHNLRHLFARTFYTLERDLSRLADILGHSSVNTTRIYTAESGAVHARQIEQMKLLVT